MEPCLHSLTCFCGVHRHRFTFYVYCLSVTWVRTFIGLENRIDDMGINLPFGKFIMVFKALKTYTKQIVPELTLRYVTGDILVQMNVNNGSLLSA